MDGPLASGRDADVYAIGGDRVLRRYRNGGDVGPEAAVMAHVARFGFPVPVIHEASGADLVMERLEGPTMLAALGAGVLGVAEAAATLADLHDRLHRIPVPGDPGTPGDTSVLHLDLHPENVMMTPGGPVVIDWRNAAEGRADLDVAMTAVILGQVAVEPGHLRSGPAHDLLSGFLGRVTGNWPAAAEEAVSIRRDDPALDPPEVDRLGLVVRLLTGIQARPEAV